VSFDVQATAFHGQSLMKRGVLNIVVFYGCVLSFVVGVLGSFISTCVYISSAGGVYVFID